MTKFEVTSNDRVGMTNDILTVFTNNNWNLHALEVKPGRIFIESNMQSDQIDALEDALSSIDGFEQVKIIEQLPSEKRRSHLDALLSRLPDPIIDVNRDGQIIVTNEAAATLFGTSIDNLEKKALTDFIQLPDNWLFNANPVNYDVTINKTPFMADITPVMSGQTLHGSVVILRSPQRIGREISAYRHHSHQRDSQIIGQSASIIQVIDQAKRFALLDLPVLINGETGTGKELFARYLHDGSNRNDKPFLTINCSAIPEHLLESELFGYASGAFSGAARGGKPGLFELANGGTVFLDEIGEMSVYLQAKLLRFLQDYTFRRVGGTQDIHVNVRIVSATHKNLPERVSDGAFREDLFYRLNVLNLTLPGLKNRPEDIPLLVEHFMQQAASQINRPSITMTDDALQTLSNYHWPGNIRQLQNVVFRTVALTDKHVISSALLQLQPFIDEHTVPGEMNEHVTDWQSAQKQFEKELLTQLYPQYPSTRKLALRLNVSHNKIAMKLKEHGIGL